MPRILCRDPANLKASASGRHYHECHNGPTDLKPNTHVCEYCPAVFDVPPGDPDYIEPVPESVEATPVS
jgi:hypothetical protein